MIRSLIGASLQARFIVMAAAAALMFFGITQLRDMPVDILPEFAPPFVEIQTEALGLSAEEVEQFITVPLEQDLLNGVPWLDIIRSRSVPGLSSIVLLFKRGTNLIRARQMVAERLTQAVALPHVSKPPTMLQSLSSTSRVMLIGLSSQSLSLIQMSVLARWTIGPRLMGVPGVANVAIWGQRERQLQVQVDPQRLGTQGVSLLQVLETTGNALWVSSLSFVEASTPGTGGFIDTANQRLGIRHISPIVTPDGLAQVPISDRKKADGTPLRLGDVANVVEDHQPLIGDAIVNDGPSLLLVVEKFPGANTLEVTRGLEKALATLGPGLSGLTMDSTLFRPASFIELALGNLGWALLGGALLLTLALLAFLWDWRITLISLVVIPLSLVAAVLVLRLSGATLNVMVLAGLLMATGILVDDAVIDVDHSARMLRQNPRAASLRSKASIILGAAAQMRGPTMFATLIILLAVSPIFFMEGVSGTFSQPLVLAMVLAVLASLLVAVIVTPALCLLLLTVGPLERRESPLAGWLRRGYAHLLAQSMRQRRPVLLGLAVLALAGFACVPFLTQTLLPDIKERDLLIHMNGAPGTSQPEMSRIAARISRELRSIPGVRDVGAHVGRAVRSDQVAGINAGELWVSIDPAVDYDRTLADVREIVHGYPGLERVVQTYIQVRSRDVLASSDAAVVVRIFGEDADVRATKAEEVRQALAGIVGIVEVHVSQPPQEPTLEITADLAAAQRYGIKPGDVRRAAAILLSGLQAGSLFEEQKVFDVVVWSTPETRHSLSSIRDLLIDTPDGEHVRLADVAHVSIVPAASVIQHEAVSRYLDVRANVKGRALDVVAGEIGNRLRQIKFPLEYHAEVLGAYAEHEAAQNRLFVIAVAALIGIFLLLQASFGSWRLAALSFFSLPAALVGGVPAALAAGGIVSLGTLVGFLAVAGIAARNGIILINHLQSLMRNENEAHGPELIVRGAGERLAPILLTAIATALAFVPVLVMGDIPGLEIVRPMAVVMLGGLVSSTLLSLFVLPALCLSLLQPPHSTSQNVLNQAQPVLAVGLIVLMLQLSACGPKTAATTDDEAPARLEQITGTKLTRVVLTARAAQRLDIQVAPVRLGAQQRKIMPYAALLYDAEGNTWAYTNPEPLHYVRQPVKVDRIDGELVVLLDGPPAGMAVVTVGAAELFGVELGVGG